VSADRPPCAQCARLRRENRRLQQQAEQLAQHVARLESQLEAARRAGKRQAAPFSKGAPKPCPHAPGRKPGSRYGRRARRAVPPAVDEIVDVQLPGQCPDCGGLLALERVRPQYHTELPPVRPHVTQFNVAIGRCRGCGQRVQGRHPRQSSDALGAAASQLGPRAVALAAQLNKGLGIPFGKLAALYQSAFGLRVSPAGLCLALQRLGRAAEPTYRGLIESVRCAPVVAPDETGWKVAGRLQWLWVFVSAEVTVYAIQSGRGFEEAAAILTAEFAGVLVRDGWAPYRQFTAAAHQTCLAHLLRRCDEMLETAQRGAARFPHAVRRLLGQALALRERHQRGAISPHGLAVARGRLEARTDRLLAGRVLYPPNRRFAKHLAHEREALFHFLGRSDVEATNWQAEQAIRPAVVTRKICGGNRTWEGARTQQILASILRTCAQQDRDAGAVFETLLRSPQPRAIVLGSAIDPRGP
jgi:transposase